MKKILSIVGARPQFIKLSPLSKELRKNFSEIILHTGQHYDNNMSNVFFEELEINKPDYNLNIGSGYHGAQTGKMMKVIEEVMIKELPDLCIVFGDTNSTLAGALVSSKLGIPIAHVEAGLRSFNRSMPEEINRVVTDHISDYLFVPNQNALDNLSNEGLNKKAYITGDIMVDSVLQNSEIALKKAKIGEKLSIIGSEYYLLTLHRPYNVDDPTKLEFIFSELKKTEKKIIFPLHPRTRKIIEQKKVKVPGTITFIEPVGYHDFLYLIQNSKKIITDSGGIQKEAYILKKPCITLRSETEWVETVDSGWNCLVDLNKTPAFSAQIVSFEPPDSHPNLFGKDVSKKINTQLLKALS